MTTNPRSTQPIDVRAVCDEMAHKIIRDYEYSTGRKIVSTRVALIESIGYIFAARFGPLVEAAPKLMKALEAELTGPPKNVPKSSWAKEWDDTDAALAKLREVNE